MSDFPNPNVSPLFISSISRYAAGFQDKIVCNLGAAAQRTWVANLAVYIPLSIPYQYPLKRMFWANGGTVTTSNADIGIYNADGTAIYRLGSTAMSGTTALQFAAATDVLLSPGRYYLGFACDNTTNRAWGVIPPAAEGRLMGLLQQATAFPLPAAMTPVAWDGTACLELCGLTRTSTGF